MITIDPLVFTLVIVCIVAACVSVAFLLGSYFSPHSRSLRDEVKVWRGRYYEAQKTIMSLEGAASENAPIGSTAGLEGIASMFLGGEKFSIGKLLGVLQSNPEIIPELIKLWKGGIAPKPNGAGSPPNGAGGRPLKQLG